MEHVQSSVQASVRRASASVPVRCTRCTRYTVDPRKGLCVPCVHRSRRGNQLPLHARCVLCGLTDVRVLRWVKLVEERGVFCANDEARLRLCPTRPVTVAHAQALLPELVRDRRRADRRAGRVDRRTHYTPKGELLRPLGGRRSNDPLPETTASASDHESV